MVAYPSLQWTLINFTAMPKWLQILIMSSFSSHRNLLKEALNWMILEVSLLKLKSNRRRYKLATQLTSTMKPIHDILLRFSNTNTKRTLNFCLPKWKNPLSTRYYGSFRFVLTQKICFIRTEPGTRRRKIHLHFSIFVNSRIQVPRKFLNLK